MDCFLRGSANDWYDLPIIVAITAVGLAASQWRFFTQWLEGIRGRKWPTISATIEIVSVVEQVHETKYGQYKDYLATLTYFYRNPELQSGDFSRLFGLQDEAQSWANSYKDANVLVHVDPRDPSKSVLNKSNL